MRHQASPLRKSQTDHFEKSTYPVSAQQQVEMLSEWSEMDLVLLEKSLQALSSLPAVNEQPVIKEEDES